jgi:hypothetical protein
MTFTGWGRISRRTRWHYFVEGKPSCSTSGLSGMKDLQAVLIRWEGTGIKGATLDQRDCCKECYRLRMGR